MLDLVEGGAIVASAEDRRQFRQGARAGFVAQEQRPGDEGFRAFFGVEAHLRLQHANRAQTGVGHVVADQVPEGCQIGLTTTHGFGAVQDRLDEAGDATLEIGQRHMARTIEVVQVIDRLPGGVGMSCPQVDVFAIGGEQNLGPYIAMIGCSQFMRHAPVDIGLAAGSRQGFEVEPPPARGEPQGQGVGRDQHGVTHGLGPSVEVACQAAVAELNDQSSRRVAQHGVCFAGRQPVDVEAKLSHWISSGTTLRLPAGRFQAWGNRGSCLEAGFPAGPLEEFRWRRRTICSPEEQ